MGRKRKQSIIAHLKEKILGPKPKSKWDTVSPEVPYTGDESAEEALENELAHELGVAFDVYGRGNQIFVTIGRRFNREISLVAENSLSKLKIPQDSQSDA